MALDNRNMQYVYVLTSSPNDTYYEQLYLSVVSFRLYNPNSEIIVLVDTTTNNSLDGKRSNYEKYISDKKVISVPTEFSQKEASRWIKTSIHHYVSGDFLFIDCDTIITADLGQNFPDNMQIGAVLDTHVTLEQHHLRNNFQKEDIKAGFSSSIKTNVRYNGGLIFCKNSSSARNFYEKWHSLWIEGRKKGCTQDMPSLNQANYEMHNVITALDGEWNCQISHNGLPYLSNAKIIHYYATSLVSFEPAYKFASSHILDFIKETGDLSPEIINLLKNPKAAFEPFSRIFSDKTVIGAFDSSVFSKLIWVNRHFPAFFQKCDRLIAFLTKITKRLIGKK